MLTREWRERMTGKLGQVGSAYSDGGSSLTPIRHLNRGGRFIIHSWPRGSLSLSRREASVVGQSPTAVSTQDGTVVSTLFNISPWTTGRLCHSSELSLTTTLSSRPPCPSAQGDFYFPVSEALRSCMWLCPFQQYVLTKAFICSPHR